MPREQRVQLSKGPVTEVTSGTFDSGIVTTQEFSRPETAIKTPGQELAEAIGLFAKGAASIYEGYESERKNEEVINWSLYGDQMGRAALEKAADLPLEEQSASLKASLEEFMGSFENHSKGRGVSKEGFQAGLGAMSSYISTGEDNIMKARIDASRKRKVAGIHVNISRMSAEGQTPKDIMEYMASNKDMYLDKQSVTIDYVRTIANDINAYMVSHPGGDIESLIKEKLLVKTLDGHDIYKVKEAKDLIDNLRQDARQGLDLYHKENYENILQSVDKEKWRNPDRLKNYAGTIDAPQMNILQGKINENKRVWQAENMSQYYNGIQKGTIGTKDLDQGLDREEITAAQHNSLTAEFHNAIRAKTAAQTHAELTQIFIDNPTKNKLYELEGMADNDGALIYKSGVVRKAYKQVLSNEYNRIAQGGFSDINALKRVFANAKGITKLDAYDSNLLGFELDIEGKPSSLIDLLNNKSINDSSKVVIVNDYITSVKNLNSVALSQGYSSNNLAKFDSEAGILRANIALHGAEGIRVYLDNRGKSFDRYHQTLDKTIAANIYKYDPNMTLYDDEEVGAGYLATQAPHVASIYNTVFNRTGDERMASEVTRQYIQDNMVQVDVEGSAFVDDRLWVYKGSGINNQQTYNKITEALGAAFGVDDDLQLYNTDPTNPDNPTWLFRDLNNQVFKQIPGDMIIDLLNESSPEKYKAIFERYNFKTKL